MQRTLLRFVQTIWWAFFALSACLLGFASPSGAVEPITVGLSLSLTGATAPAGKQVLTGLEIWRDRVNAQGGLLGRPIALVCYDDQSSPANAPGIYAKLMDVDKVELLIGPDSTNVIAAAMPAIIEHKRMTIGIFGLGVNKTYNYPRYFSINSQGASPRNYSRGLFQLALQQQPKPMRVALVGTDVEFSRNALDGARENAKEFGFEVAYESEPIRSLMPITRASCGQCRRHPPIWFMPPRCRLTPPV